ncbi:TetR family transcriptional regulator [Leucobacter weissii]|uniref:TetR family transcriptional regulator n=1 Tax=Leucobacter weissii TaxID=1983706 RepID=A0A939MLG1_9MICO|nr:TetR/AcrR family transcriptional regulator [Leucobacter weissii]MBO1900977.1 TetR family transcriptional regulator [Leucobacter weissii]
MTSALAAALSDRLSEERRKIILTAAAECIAEQGYDGVRMREVSRRAGVSVGLIQHYFDTRDELLAQAIRHLSEELLSAFARPSAAPRGAWERIEALVDHLCSVTDIREHSFMWIAFGAAVAGHPELRPQLERVYRSWERIVRGAIEDGAASGELDPVGDIDDTVAAYLAFFDGYEYDMGTGLVEADVAELRRRALLLGRALLRPRPIDAPPSSARY